MHAAKPGTILRRQLRQQRRQLPARVRQQAGRQVARLLAGYAPFRQAKNIGLYLSAFGEVPTLPIMQLCFRQVKHVYLPQIRHIDQKLVWVKVSQKQWYDRRFYAHALGMHEPSGRGMDVDRLDLIIMPLLAFDGTGTRMGMGGGYYDRTLWHKHRSHRLGLAYEFQQVDRLERQPWDQPLDAVLTPGQIYRFYATKPSAPHFFVNK